MHSVIAKDHADSVSIYKEVRSYCRETFSRWPLNDNLAFFFFSDLSQYLISIQLKLNEIASAYPPRESTLKLKNSTFFYVDYDDLVSNRPIDVASKKYGIYFPVPRSRKTVALETYLRLRKLTGSRAPVVGVCGSQVQTKDLLKVGCLVRQVRINSIEVSDAEMQLEGMVGLVRAVGARFAWGDRIDAIVEIWRRHVRACIRPELKEKLNCDVYLTGTLGDLKNRFGAFRARQLGIPVITNHQYFSSDAAYDNGYELEVEHSLCDVMFGIGVRERFTASKPGLTELLNPRAPVYVPSRKLDSPNLSVEPLSVKKQRLLYVPDSLGWLTRYGPRYHINHELYLAWQKRLIEAFQGCDLTLKKHIKGAHEFRSMGPRELLAEIGVGPEAVKVETAPFEQVVSGFDALIFDTIGNAFNAAVGTRKPIIFLDIEKSGFSERGRELLNERCTVISVDPENPGNLVERIESLQAESQRKTNAFLRESLSLPDAAEWLDLKQLKLAVDSAMRVRRSI